uniref:Uncharacterized protein n=1 Tax=Rhizophora mucronata TaxID=61149 RepID=A0A2P2Q653_RHIMU
MHINTIISITLNPFLLLTNYRWMINFRISQNVTIITINNNRSKLAKQFEAIVSLVIFYTES